MPDSPVRSRAEIERCLHDLGETLARCGVRSLALFGSAARDALGPKSDVDLLVEFDGPTRFDDFMELKLLLEDRLGRRVDLLTPRALQPRLAERIRGELRRVA
jgi:predicted nucleotidyltransferase